jgi:hypothetical protein
MVDDRVEQLRAEALAARERVVLATSALVEAREAARTARDAYAASLSEYRPSEIVERFANWGKRLNPPERWRVDAVRGEWGWRGDDLDVKLVATYINKSGQPGKRTGELKISGVRRPEAP